MAVVPAVRGDEHDRVAVPQRGGEHRGAGLTALAARRREHQHRHARAATQQLPVAGPEHRLVQARHGFGREILRVHAPETTRRSPPPGPRNRADGERERAFSQPSGVSRSTGAGCCGHRARSASRRGATSTIRAHHFARSSPVNACARTATRRFPAYSTSGAISTGALADRLLVGCCDSSYATRFSYHSGSSQRRAAGSRDDPRDAVLERHQRLGVARAGLAPAGGEQDHGRAEHRPSQPAPREPEDGDAGRFQQPHREHRRARREGCGCRPPADIHHAAHVRRAAGAVHRGISGGTQVAGAPGGAACGTRVRRRRPGSRRPGRPARSPAGSSGRRPARRSRRG